MTGSGCDYQMRDYEALLDASRRQVVSNPKEWTGHFNWAWVIRHGENGGSDLCLSEALEISEGNPNAGGRLAQAYARVGKRALAEKILADLEKSKERPRLAYIRLPQSIASLGEKGKALNPGRAIKNGLWTSHHIKSTRYLRRCAFHDLMHRMAPRITFDSPTASAVNRDGFMELVQHFCPSRQGLHRLCSVYKARRGAL